MTMFSPVVAILLIACIIWFLLAGTPRSLPRQADPCSLNIARRHLSLTVGPTVASLGLCGAAAVFNDAPSGVALIVLGLVPQLVLLGFVVATRPRNGPVGGMLTPRRIRDLVPSALVGIAAIVGLVGLAVAGTRAYAASRPAGTGGFGCLSRPVGTYQVKTGSTIMSYTPAFDMDRPFSFGFGEGLAAFVIVASTVLTCLTVWQVHRRPSLVPDGRVDFAVRKIISVRACAMTVIATAAAAQTLASGFVRELRDARMESDSAASQADLIARGATFPQHFALPPDKCVIHPGILHQLNVLGAVADSVTSVGLFLGLAAIAYLVASRGRRTSTDRGADDGGPH